MSALEPKHSTPSVASSDGDGSLQATERLASSIEQAVALVASSGLSSVSIAAAVGAFADRWAEVAGSAANAAVISKTTHAIEVRWHGISDVGLVRTHNEDNFLIADLSLRESLASPTAKRFGIGSHGAVMAVCDGMGGAAAGEVASKMAVEVIFEAMRCEEALSGRDAFAERLIHAVEEAGRRIFEAARSDRSRRGMGTTATVAGLIDRVLFVGQVGDSRAYVLRRGALLQVTKDQSLVNQLLEAGQITEEEAEVFEHSNIILQALGTAESVSVAVTCIELRNNDRLLLCSDGLSGLANGEAIREILSGTPDLEECAQKLIDLANLAGGHDNITVVLADFSGDGLAVAEESSRLSFHPYEGGLDEEAFFEDTTTRRSKAMMLDGEQTMRADPQRARTPKASHPSSRRRKPKRPALWQLGTLGLFLAGLSLVIINARDALRSPDAATPESGAKPSEEPAEVDPAEAHRRAAAASPASESELLRQEVKVTVRSDIDGQLYVDGHYQGRIQQSQSVSLELRPGVYLLEGRTNGEVVATTLLTVRPGLAAEVSLLSTR